MIQESLSKKNAPVVSSDHWHVLLARWSGGASFERSIVSEHDDQGSAATAARAMHTKIKPDMASRPRVGRDQILVRHPNYKSLKTAGRAKRRLK
jgi:hypothetical protein